MPLSGSNVFVCCPLVSPLSTPLHSLLSSLFLAVSRAAARSSVSLSCFRPRHYLTKVCISFPLYPSSPSLLHLWKDKISVPARALVFSLPRPFCLRMLSLSWFRFVCSRDRYSFLLICDHPLAPPISCVRLE
jgi:hypothetical protein